VADERRQPSAARARIRNAAAAIGIEANGPSSLHSEHHNPLWRCSRQREDLWSVAPNRVTDVSRIRGTRRTQEDTRGHDGE
jgi:hypothetical protein